MPRPYPRPPTAWHTPVSAGRRHDRRVQGRPLRNVLAAAAALLAAACAAPAAPPVPVPGPSASTAPARTGAPGLKVSTVAAGLRHVWDVGFLPDGRVLVTEREGRLS